MILPTSLYQSHTEAVVDTKKAAESSVQFGAENGGSTSVESPATATKEANTTAIQFEAPIILMPHLVRHAQAIE